MDSARRDLFLLLLLAGSLAAACRNSHNDGTTGIKLVPSSFGANGCTGPNQTFTPGQTRTPLALTTLVIGPYSQVTAAGNSDTLYVSGANATVVAIDVSGAAPVEAEILAAGQVAALLSGVGIGAAPELSGLCVVDADSLLAIEHASNTILHLDRTGASAPEFYAGLPSTLGGFADGTSLAVPNLGQARFDFQAPCQLISSDPLVPLVFVADIGNHAIRRIASGFVDTIGGSGTPFFADGDLQTSGFDSPSGLSVTCSGTLLVSETGAGGGGGHRLRQILLGQQTFFGQEGDVVTRAGNGSNATIQGDNESASLAAPRSPLSTAQGETYWIDANTGILRRMQGADDSCDCPLWTDCASAVSAGGDFTPGGVLSLTQTPSGLLFVLDADAGQLWRITP